MEPFMVGFSPVDLCEDDGDGAKSGGDLVANGGASDLGNAVLHNGYNACTKRCLDDGGNVFEVNGSVVVCVELGGCLDGTRLCAHCGGQVCGHVDCDAGKFWTLLL